GRIVTASHTSVRCLFFFQAEDGIRDFHVTGVQTCALPILRIVGWKKSYKARRSWGLFRPVASNTRAENLPATSPLTSRALALLPAWEDSASVVEPVAWNSLAGLAPRIAPRVDMAFAPAPAATSTSPSMKG